MSQNALHSQAGVRPSGIRAFNAVVCVGLIIFCAVHVILGILFWYGLIGNGIVIAAWIGVGLVILHAILSVATTVSMMADKDFSPSRNKKQHQALKWITGLLAVALLVVHLTLGNLVGNIYFSKGAFIALALLILLSIHVYISIRSLTHDLQLSPELRRPFRIGVIFFCAFTVTLFGLVSI